MVEKFPVFVIKNYLFCQVQWSLALGYMQECSNMGLSSPSVTLWLYFSFFLNLFACLLDA